jgi:hypothetical protein
MDWISTSSAIDRYVSLSHTDFVAAGAVCVMRKVSRALEIGCVGIGTDCP